MYWLDHDRTMRISAFFRSPDDWARIPAWGVDMPADPASLPRQRLDHGYDESGRPKHSTWPRCSGQRAFAAAAVNPRTWSRGRCSRRCAGAAASGTCSRRRPTWYCAADTGVPNAPRPAGTMTSRRAAARSWPRCGTATTTAPKAMSTPATATRTSRPADVAGSTGHGGTGASQANARISHIPC